ncbi:MAG: hypothetical protein ACRC8S_20815 [Fimbriiglobus sp.]
MKRILCMIAAAFGVLALSGTANAAGPLNGTVAPTMIGGASANYGLEQRYGVLPWLGKNMWWRPGAGSCQNCGPNGGHPLPPPGYGVPGYPQPGQPGMGMPGTLVFPNHPFARSPRDFFMWEK